MCCTQIEREGWGKKRENRDAIKLECWTQHRKYEIQYNILQLPTTLMGHTMLLQTVMHPSPLAPLAATAKKPTTSCNYLPCLANKNMEPAAKQYLNPYPLSLLMSRQSQSLCARWSPTKAAVPDQHKLASLNKSGQA